MLQNLQCQMGGAPEPIQPDRCAGPYLRALDRSVADDAGAEERRYLLICNRPRQRVCKILAHRRPLRVAAVSIPSGEAGIGAEIFPISPAVRTYTTGLAQPGDSDPCTGAEAPATLAEFHHFTNDFMAWNNPLMTGRQIALRHVQIGAAYPADSNPHQQLARLRPRPFDFDRLQRIGFNRRGRSHRHRPHQM